MASCSLQMASPHITTAPTLGPTRPWLALLASSAPISAHTIPQRPTHHPAKRIKIHIHPMVVMQMTCCFSVRTSSNLPCPRQREEDRTYHWRSPHSRGVPGCKRLSRQIISWLSRAQESGPPPLHQYHSPSCSGSLDSFRVWVTGQSKA